MKQISKWTKVHFLSLENRNIKMSSRYSLSKSISFLFPNTEYEYDLVNREGLGAWCFVAFENKNGTMILIGSSVDDQLKNGASMWLNASLSMKEAKDIILEISNVKDIDLIPSE